MRRGRSGEAGRIEAAAPAAGPVLGDGPIYPAGLGTRALLHIAPAARFNSRDWGGDKVLWVRRPGVREVIVFRAAWAPTARRP